MGGLSKEGQHPSTGPPTYQIIKVTNTNHMSMMKTYLTTIPMCPRERFALYKSSSRLVLCYIKDWATLLHFTCYSLPFILSQNYLSPTISVLAENTLLKPLVISFCSSLGSTLLLIERTMIDPLYLWVIKTLFWCRCRGVKRLW